MHWMINALTVHSGLHMWFFWPFLILGDCPEWSSSGQGKNTCKVNFKTLIRCKKQVLCVLFIICTVLSEIRYVNELIMLRHK